MKTNSLPVWSEVTAIYGGRFDPPHLGHREAVCGLFRRPGIKKVIVVPTALPPQKVAVVPAQQRLKMTQLNFASTPLSPLNHEILVSDIEFKRAEVSPSHPNYAYETIQELSQNFQNLAYVIGTDQFENLHTWNRFPELLKLSHWIVLERKSYDHSIIEKTLSEWQRSGLAVPTSRSSTWQIGSSQRFLTLVPTDAPELSSTQIRETIVRTGRPPADSLLQEVSAYLYEQRLYGIRGSS